MRRQPGRWARAVAIIGVGVLGMILAHCAGFEIVHRAGLGAVSQASHVVHPAHPAHSTSGEHGAHVEHSAHRGLSPHGVHEADGVAGHVVRPGSPHADHAEVLPIASGTLLVISAAFLAAVVVGGRRCRFRGPGAPQLLAVQLCSLVLLEGFGALVKGAPLLVWPVALAVLLQVPVAVLLARLLRRAADFLELVLRGRRPQRRRSEISVDLGFHLLGFPATHWSPTTSPRGPPSLLRIHP